MQRMTPWGGFDHNAQSLRVVTRLERRYAEFDGLNLCWETLEGLVKHNGPLTGPHADLGKGAVPKTILDFNELFDLELDRFASLEAQCAAIADDIAYNTHDIDDGLRAGLLSLDMLEEVPLSGDDPGGGAQPLSQARRRAHRSRADAPPDHADGRGRHRDRRGRLAGARAGRCRRRPQCRPHDRHLLGARWRRPRRR